MHMTLRAAAACFQRETRILTKVMTVLLNIQFHTALYTQAHTTHQRSVFERMFCVTHTQTQSEREKEG